VAVSVGRREATVGGVALAVVLAAGGAWASRVDRRLDELATAQSAQAASVAVIAHEISRGGRFTAQQGAEMDRRIDQLEREVAILAAEVRR
jgi:hypothetical protein